MRPYLPFVLLYKNLFFFFIFSLIDQYLLSYQFFLNTRSTSLCLRSFKAKGHGNKICLRVLFLPLLYLSFASDIFHPIRFTRNRAPISIKTVNLAGSHSLISLLHVFFYRSSHRRCSVKKVFLEILQNAQENTCPRPATLLERGSGTDIFL